MAGTDRKTTYDLTRVLDAAAEKPYEFGFYAFLRHIECLHADKPRLGVSQRPIDDPIRIGQEPATTFESSSLTSFQAAQGDAPHRLLVRCLGLLGPNGPLPLHLTEYALERLKQHHDPTFVRFLDMFHHRMLSLFYRAWAIHEPVVSFDRPETDQFSTYVGSMMGLGPSALRKRDDISDLTKFHYCGRIGGQTRCAEGLQDVLSDFFRLPADVEPFMGEWLDLPQRNICRLGLDPIHGTLGRTVVIGLRVWECQHKFRIRLGALSLDDYENFLPVGSRIKRLVALVRNYIGDELAWDLQLILKRDEVQGTRLDKAYRLGWTTWLGNRPRTTDADDLVFNAFAFFTHPKQGM